ncbi:PP2C family protein-serine/threonine phosphatase [Treponema pectinovorum]|uniref:PP2C family protein-serine/threonine phosphatase n=1 Tax=Treponema pectinovorum TaxID=164 RepID=UPI0011CB825B|nr:PP2C family protein-serine/threonine phosphatase [Treponema pectinovorum]
MIYVVLNIVMALYAIGLAFYVDRQSKEKVANPLIIMSVYLAAAFALVALTLLANSFFPDRLPIMFFRVSLICSTIFEVEFCTYCILFPSYRRSAFVKILKWVAALFAVWFCFTKISGVNITQFLGLSVDSIPLFTGKLTNYFPVSWYDFYRTLTRFILPALAALIMILRAENREDRLNMQKAIMNMIALVAGWIGIYVITQARGRVPMFDTLILAGLGVTHVILSYSSNQNLLYDFKYVIGGIITFTTSYLLPAFIIGFFFPFLWPIFSNSHLLFFTYVALVIVICIAISYQVSKFLEKKQYFRSFLYAQTFENQLSKLDYSLEPEEIVHNVKNIFVHNLGLSKMTILIESENLLKPIYEDEPSGIVLDLKDKVIDSLLNQGRTIVLKSDIENSHVYESEKLEILELFTKTSLQAIILLAEGRRVIGALCLGEKAGGNIYAAYDFNTFTKLYSYLFVFGYYLKNIANQAIVGTVNREIKMSNQIIASIQENMDHIQNLKFDTGYIMEHAHNIGGEFIDLIRLSEKRHIFVLGDLSGKGISASMGMVIIKSIIRTYLEETRDFKLLIEKVNNFIHFNLPKGTFFEGVFGLIDFADDTLYYINCGVPALFLYTQSYNNVIEIQGEGRVLGFVKDIGKLIKVKKVTLNPGDIVVTCTDGLIDSKSLRGEQYGKERIQKSITESTAFSAHNMAYSIYQAAADFLSKELDDDASILVIKRLENF